MKRCMLLVLASVFVLGCPYYNTFYNARKAFDEAERIRREALKNGTVLPEQARQLYVLAIENSALILRDYPYSDLVDDALVLIGDAFIAQEEYPKAIRKYEEVLANYPDSKWVPYCAYALGQSSLSAGDTTRAEEALREFLVQYPVSKWAPEAHMLLGGIDIDRQQYQAAIDEYTDFITSFPKHKRRPEAQYYIAESYMELDRYTEALDLFETVGRTARTREFEFQARYMAGECLRRDEQYDTALQTFEQLVKRSSYIAYRPKLMLSIASCQRSLNQIDKALENLQGIAETYEKDRMYDAEVSQAFFEIGSIYERQGDLEQAEQHYLNAKNRSPRSFWVYDNADQKSNDIHQLQQYRQDLIRALDAIRAPVLDDSTRTAEGDTARAPVLDDSTRTVEGDTVVPVDPKALDMVIQARFKLAETYLFQFNLVDSALVQYRQAEEEAGETEAAAKAAYASAWIMEHTLGDTISSRIGYRNLLKEYESTSYASAAAHALLIPDPLGPSDADLFGRAEYLLFTMQQPDSAVGYYQQIADQFPDGAYASRALYAIGWIAETYQSAPDSALSVYHRLTDVYPRSEESKLAELKIRYVEELRAELAAADSMTGDSTAVHSESVGDTLLLVRITPDDRHGEVVKIDMDQVVIKLRKPFPMQVGNGGYLFTTSTMDSMMIPVRAANIRVSEVNISAPRKGTNPGVNINLYASPSGKTIAILSPGKIFDVLEDHEGWLKIRVDEQEGFVKNDDVEADPVSDSTVLCQIEERFQTLTADDWFGAFFDDVNTADEPLPNEK